MNSGEVETSRVVTRTCRRETVKNKEQRQLRQTDTHGVAIRSYSRYIFFLFFFGLIPHDLFDPVLSAHRRWIGIVTI